MAEWLTSLRLRVRALLRRRQLEKDLGDELAFHMAMREDALRGGGDAAAHVRTRWRFGNPVSLREDLRELWSLAPRLGSLARNVRFAARTLATRPGFAVTVVLTLGIAIGGTTAMFAIVDAALLRPFRFAAEDRLVAIHEGFAQVHIDQLPFGALDFEDLRRLQQSFSAVAAYRNVALEMSGNGRPERISAAKVSPELFGLLGVAPLFGRTFSAEEGRPGVNVAVLSYALWRNQFGGDRSILGRAIHLDRQPYTVVGVMPAGFVFPRRGAQFNGEPADLWVPLAFMPRERLERANGMNNSVIGRLRDGVSLEAARAELGVVGRRIADAYPPVVIRAGFSPALSATPLREEISGRVARPLWMLFGAVGLVLIVACANVANLMLTRAIRRRHEFAVRRALGARRVQLVHLLLGETLLLAFAAGALGVALAYWAVKAAPLVLVRTVPGVQDLAIDYRVLLFTVLVCFATAVFFAIAPVPALDRRDAADTLRDESPRTASQHHVQRAFVVVTVTLACVLLAAAGLFLRSFAALMSTDIGFRPSQVIAASMTLPRTFYTTADSIRSFHAALSSRLSSIPGVKRAAIATDLPLTSYDSRAFTPEGGASTGSALLTTNLSFVAGPYFETLGVTLAAGRYFDSDEHQTIRNVVIVNERLASVSWPGQNPVGKRIKWGPAASPNPWLTVVGVIRNVVDGPVGAVPGVHAYEPFRQFPDFFLNGAPNQFGRDVKALVLTDRSASDIAPLVRQQISELDPELAVESLAPMNQQISDAVAPQRFSSMIVAAFAGVGLLLAVVGLYGLLAFTVGQRQKEIAVRVALGAERGAVITMVVVQGMRLVFWGLLLGMAAAVGAARVASSLTYQSDPLSVAAFAIIPAALIPAALLACAIPAWRAARLDPVLALRAE